jgi:serine/threonine protein kinase/tetratricopeptide (TPR) repeat protein
MGLATGVRLGRYEILGPLGAGGMGEVYRARDNELEREVAVKVLPTSVANDPKRLERFQREARAVAALSHPNILEIHDVGTHNGVHYAVTELLEGQTLRERLPGKGMPWQKVAEIGAGIAEGLAAAHGKGIVHRDLKPENIFITSDGRVKVLDFGLARIATEVSSEAATETLTPAGTVAGTIMGTPGYMAPEQVRGKPADHRSDIFALGCVLYEMVAGRRAFSGDTTPDIMAAILREDPPRPSAAGATLPVDLERTVNRCLEKSPEARFQSVADLAYSLRSTATDTVVPMATPNGEVRPIPRRLWPIAVAVTVVVAAASVATWLSLNRGMESRVGAPAPVQAPPSPFLDEWRVAVEPFDNRSGDPALDPIGRTLTDRAMEGLARIGQGLESLTPVTVLAAGASGGGADEEQSRNIGRLLVTGFYSDRGEALEVSAQVRDPDTRGVLFSTGQIEVSRPAGDTEVAPVLERVMGAVAIHVQDRLPNVSHVPDYAVFREFVTGIDAMSSGTPGGEDSVARAFELDPEYLQPAFRMAADTVARKRFEKSDPLIDHIRLRHQRLTEYEGLWLTMLEAFRQGALARALQASREAQRIAPHDFIVRYGHARFASDLGEYEEVVETLAGVIEHLPPSYRRPQWNMAFLLATSFHELGRFEEALALARRLRSEMPGDTVMYTFEASALAALGRLDEFAEVVAACEGVPGGECDVAYVLARGSWHLAANGHRDAARSSALRSAEIYRSRMEDGAMGCGENVLFALRAAELWVEYGECASEMLERSEEGTFAHANASCAVGMAKANLGDRAGAEEIIRRLEAEEYFVFAGHVAAYLGELDRAVEYIKRGVASEATSGYDQFPRWNLDLEPLWDYPPFRESVGWDD